MRVLMQNRLDAFSSPGGDTIQMLKTKEYLGKLGVEVDISLDLKPDLNKYNIVHLFNITRVHETYLQFINAKKHNKPIVLSSIYQDYDELDAKASYGIKGIIWRRLEKEKREKIKTFVRAAMDIKQLKAARVQMKLGYRKEQKIVISGADIVLPNSMLEAQAIKNEFNVEFKYEVVPNAVDEIFAQKDNSFTVKTDWQNYVLCVGNYIDRKNQFALLEALADTGMPLVMIGSVVKAYKGYYNKIKKAASRRKVLTKILEKVSQKELVSLYSGAKVVVLPSWSETTGLSCLEGALAGCNVVVTNRGYTREYFGNLAYYCDPANINSIRKAVLDAYNNPVNPNLKEHILSNYTWDKTAAATLSGYQRVLKK